MFVASAEFMQAADAQSRSLGLDVARVFVPHPIQDRTDEEMREYADRIYADVVRAITA